jgi:hypothetical protein
MGLDITAYSNLTPIGKHTKNYCEDDNHVHAYAYSCFPASFRGIPVLGTERDDYTEFLEGGCYAITEWTRTHGFRAGSYSGYNHWRDNLKAQFNPNTEPDGPFYELIWFADNEGSIGSEAAADLLLDFEVHAATYQPLYHEHPEWDTYTDWMRAFELAAVSGLVEFH